MIKFIILSSLFYSLFSSCAGYRFQEKRNPFSQYGIDSLSVPMFYNYSNFANVSGKLTKEVIGVLTDFKGLRLYTGRKPADAVLIGIIESDKNIKESKIVTSTKGIKNTYGQDSIGTRKDFNLPTANKIRLRLRIIVLRHPTEAEINFFQKNISEQALGSKVIFNESIWLEESFNLKELKEESISVLGSQNQGVERQAIDRIAKQAATGFKDMILYAF